MSVQDEIKRMTAPDIAARKGGEPIVCLTSYHAHTARLVDRYCDVILVGDSLGMVMHGLETTVPVTLDMMILQGHAVMRGSKRALVVVDMPFGSYEQSKEQAFASCARVLKETHCGAIKLEGGRRIDHGLVAGKVRLRGQHVHALRAADARHQLHGEQRDTRLGERSEAFGVGEWIEHADQRSALFHALDDVLAWPPDREHDVGIGDRVGVGLGDLRAGFLVVIVREMGPEPRAGANP